MSHKTHNGRGPGEKFTFTCFLIEVSFGSLELYFDVFSKLSRKQDIEVRKNWLLEGRYIWKYVSLIPIWHLNQIGGRFEIKKSIKNVSLYENKVTWVRRKKMKTQKIIQLPIRFGAEIL